MEKNGHVHAQTEFSKITDEIYIGTNLCCTYLPHIEVLMKEGIAAEIDLEEERQEPPPKLSINLWLPVKDHTAPSISQMQAGSALIKQLVDTNTKVYIHCRLGHGRSPTLVAAYFIGQGMTVDESIENIKSKRSEIHIENSQRAILEDYAKL